MDHYTDKKTYNKIIKARTVLLVGQPFFGCLAMHMSLVEVQEENLVGTMAVDGTNVYYHPPFVNTLSEQELVGVMAHEVMHCAYKHFSRRNHRNPIIWNWAGDYVINADLLKAKFTLPGQPIGVNSPPGTKGHLFDPQFDGFSTEEVYEKLKQKTKTIKITMSGGQGKLDPQADKGGCGGVIDAGSLGKAEGSSKQEKEAADRKWDTTVRIAANVAKRANAGLTPGYLERLVKELKEPRVSWRELTRQFIDQSMTKDYSWQRPNKRYLGQGLILPGFIPDALHLMNFGIDVSGSISHEMAQKMLSEVSGALDDGTADQLNVIYFDTEVRHVDTFTPGDLVQCRVIAGGGTHFDDTFKWIKNNAADAACTAVLTDMMTASFGEDPGHPVLWGAYLPQAMLASIKPPFGDIVQVDSED
jgi:predicted metal-dependent peptidase